MANNNSKTIHLSEEESLEQLQNHGSQWKEQNKVFQEQIVNEMNSVLKQDALKSKKHLRPCILNKLQIVYGLKIYSCNNAISTINICIAFSVSILKPAI